MAVDYTTTGILDSVRLRAMIPTSQSLFTTARLLSIINEVQYSMVIPWIMSNRADYFKAYVDIPVDTTNTTYALPSATIGGKIVGIYYGKDSGQPGQKDWDACVQIETGDAYDAEFRTRRPFAYTITSNSFTVYPLPQDTTHFFRVWYFKRPSALVETTSCGLVSSVASPMVTLSSIPASWTTSTSLDITQGRPHFGVIQTAAPSNISGSDVTFTTLDSTVQAGDYLSMAGETCIPQLPYELWTFLIQGSVVQCFKILGNPGWQAALEELQRTMQAAKNLIAPRADDEPKKLTGMWF